MAAWPDDTSVDPFVRYRTLQHAYWLHRAMGRTDADHVALVQRLEQRIAAVAGTPFTITPFDLSDAMTDALGVPVWCKDETGNVAGSHKARHLMGLLLHLEIRRVPSSARLAIASCGKRRAGRGDAREGGSAVHRRVRAALGQPGGPGAAAGARGVRAALAAARVRPAG